MLHGCPSCNIVTRLTDAVSCRLSGCVSLKGMYMTKIIASGRNTSFVGSSKVIAEVICLAHSTYISPLQSVVLACLQAFRDYASPRGCASPLSLASPRGKWVQTHAQMARQFARRRQLRRLRSMLNLWHRVCILKQQGYQKVQQRMSHHKQQKLTRCFRDWRCNALIARLVLHCL